MYVPFLGKGIPIINGFFPSLFKTAKKRPVKTIFIIPPYKTEISSIHIGELFAP